MELQWEFYITYARVFQTSWIIKHHLKKLAD